MTAQRQPDPYTCPACGASHATEEELAEHMRTHGGPVKGMLRCSVCGATFNTDHELALHTQERHVPNLPPPE